MDYEDIRDAGRSNNSYCDDDKSLPVTGQERSVVGEMVSQVVEQHLSNCHLMLLTTTPQSGVVSTIISLLEIAGLRKLPETRVVVVGGTAGVEAVLLHPSFRNTIHAIYLAVQPYTLHSSQRGSHLSIQSDREGEASHRVWVYRRCLYCSEGQAGIQFVLHWSLSSRNTAYSANLFAGNGHISNMQGHELRAVTVPYFPYIDFHKRTGEDSSEPVIPLDSLDVRILSTFAHTVNFSYRIYAEPNRSFGEERKTGFTGMIGQLQREEFDLSTIVAPTPGRLKAVDYLRTYPSDPLTLTSLKPTVLPAHLSMIRPFSTEVWLGVILGTVGWGVTMWMMQQVWVWVSGDRGVQFSTALLYGCGALVEHPPPDPSVSSSGQMLVGWWLVFCLIIGTGFRSSLIAHLTVLGTTEPLDTFEDLTERDNWRWIIEPWLYKGATLEYFSKHTHPVVRHIQREMQVMEANEALQKVAAGGYTLIDHRNYISVLVTSRYTDAQGQTPFYISNHGISVLATFGWGLRQGAPFFRRFRQLMQRLEDGGIIEHWTGEVIARRVRETRQNTALGLLLGNDDSPKNEDKAVPLGLNHLQGAFYLLFLGSSLAALILLAEVITHSKF